MYDTANRLADDAGWQKKVTSKCRGGFREGWGHHQTKVKVKHEFAPKLFYEESQGNVTDTLLHPI